MQTIRKILMPLLMIPLGMFVYVCLNPDWQWEHPGLEYLFLLIGVPILIVNFAAWFQPEMIKAYFPVKDDWGQRKTTLAIGTSVLIAFTVTGASVISAVSSADPRPMPGPSSGLAVTATAFALTVEKLSDVGNSSENVMIPTQLESIPGQTAQIPVSGGVPTASPTLAATQTEMTALPSIETTSTVDLFARCTPAASEYLNAIWQAVEDADFDSEVETGWMVQSGDAANLWFVAAKIYRPEIDAETTLPGVWALFVYTEGNFDIYSINEIAMEFSYTAWGEDSEPVITMQNDGAQIAYNCAAREE